MKKNKNKTGAECFRPWRCGLVQELPRATRGYGLGLFPLQNSGIQQSRMLGPTKGSSPTFKWA